MLKDRSFITIIISFSLLVLVNTYRPRPALVLPLSSDPVRQSGAIGERFWVLKTHAKTRFDMLLMGDSRVYRGLSPQAMQTVLPGYRILNYGYSGGGLNPVMYAAAEGRLDLKSQQKSIILGVTPLTLTPRAEKNEHYLQELNRSADYTFMDLYLLPLVRLFEPFTLFEPIILNDLSVFLKGSPPPTHEGYYLEFHDDGWIASWTIPEDPWRTLPSFRDIFTQTPVSQKLVQELMEQTRRWVEQGIKVYAFRVPSSRSMVDLENQMSGFDETSFVEQFTAAGGIWFSIPIEPYHSYDGSHLTKESAVQLSTDLARLVQNAK